MSQSVKVSRIETERVEFEEPTGNLSLSLKHCRRFVYEDYRTPPPDRRQIAGALTLSALSKFLSE